MRRAGHSFVRSLVVILALLLLIEVTFGTQLSRARLARAEARSQRRLRSQNGLVSKEVENRRAAMDCTVTKPGEQYECMNDQWTYFETILPSGSTLPVRRDELEIEGSLYMADGSNITLSGLEAFLYVEDCAWLKSLAVIALSEDDVERIRDAKKTQDGAKYLLIDSKCDGMKEMKVTIQRAPRECRVYSATLVHSEGAGRFYTHIEYAWSSSHCNYWWIILISILLITPTVIGIMYGLSWLFKTKPKNRRSASVAVR